jgi:hypothetical protein
MKITRLRNGYRIRLSDTEFEALAVLVDHGQADLTGEDLDQHPIPKRVASCIQTGTFSVLNPLAVDEDRRK